MALRAIRLNRDPVLYRKCREVEQVDDKVRQLLDDMLQTLHATSNGAAIAAPQVGVLRRLVVIDMGELSGGVLKLVNPKIIHKQGRQVCDEGCLSFPDQWAQTVRPYQVTVQALDENGQEIQLTGEGELAQCFCHELDHLDGIVFLQRAIKTSSAAPSKGTPQAEQESLMEWVQLVLPQEGMLPALLCYRQRFGEDGCIHLQGMTQENFYEWLSCWQERMLGIECNQQWLYLALTCEDKVVGSAQVSRERDGYTHSVLLAPDGPPQLFEQIEQQLCDMGYLPVVSAEQ